MLASLLACPLCAENIQTPAEAGLNQGIASGILFFLVLVGVMASGVILFMVRSDPQRKKNRQAV